MLEYNQKQIDPILTRGDHKDLDGHYFSQSIFDLTKRKIRINSNITLLIKQTLKYVEKI